MHPTLSGTKNDHTSRAWATASARSLVRQAGHEGKLWLGEGGTPWPGFSFPDAPSAGLSERGCEGGAVVGVEGEGQVVADVGAMGQVSGGEGEVGAGVVDLV